MLAERGWPAPGAFLVVGSVWEAAAGAVLMTGAWTAWAAGALIAFTLVVSLTLLDFWTQEGDARAAALNGFLMNLALIGGLILAAMLG